MHERIEQRFQEGIEAFRAEDYARAKERWWDLAFQDRHPAAQTNLGVLYAYGLGVKRDDEAARRWYQRAIAQGYPPAQDNLKALEQSIKAGQPRAMPQRKQPRLQMAEWLMLATFLGLIIYAEWSPADPGVTKYNNNIMNQGRRDQRQLNSGSDSMR